MLFLHGNFEDLHLGVTLVLDALLVHNLVFALEVDPLRRLINLLII